MINRIASRLIYLIFINVSLQGFKEILNKIQFQLIRSEIRRWEDFSGEKERLDWTLAPITLAPNGN